MDFKITQLDATECNFSRSEQLPRFYSSFCGRTGRLYYIYTLKQELGSTKTYERISTDERSIVNTHSIDITAKFEVSI